MNTSAPPSLVQRTAQMQRATSPSPTQEPPAPTPSESPFLDGVGRVLGDVVTVAAGTVGGAIGVVTNGCAGGAQGMMKGAAVDSTTAAVGFQIAFAANLMLVGGVAYGAGSAVSTLMAGQATWRSQGEATRQQTRETVDRTVGAALGFLPPADPLGRGRLVGQAAIGEVVGLAAGAVVGARNGYLAGAALGARAVDFVAEKVRGAFV